MKSEQENTMLKPAILAPHPPNPDRRGHCAGRQRACPCLRCRTGDRRAADHRIGSLVRRRQAREVSQPIHWPPMRVEHVKVGPGKCATGSARRLDHAVKPGPFHRFTISRSGRVWLRRNDAIGHCRLSRFEMGTIVHLTGLLAFCRIGLRLIIVSAAVPSLQLSKPRRVHRLLPSF